MEHLEKRIDLHTHSLLSDGMLLPSEAVRYATVMGFAALAITDHVDYSNLESVIKQLLSFEKNQAPFLDIKFIPGVEITHVDPTLIRGLAKKAKRSGAKIVVCHGETPSEPVKPGTNHTAVSSKGIVDILAHPGMISEEDVSLAKQNGVFLELSAKPAHKETNRHVAQLAKKIGAKMLVNTDAHGPDDYITQEKAFALAVGCGLNDAEAKEVVWNNPVELLGRIGIRIT